MKKRVYIKPSFKEVEIKLNDLCAGSVCTEVDINIPMGGITNRTNIYIQGDLDINGMWDDKF